MISGAYRRVPRPESVRATALFFGAAAGAHTLVAAVALVAVTAETPDLVLNGDWAIVAPVAVAVPSPELRLAAGVLSLVLAGLSWRAARVLTRLDPGAERPAASAAWLSLLNPPFGTLFGLLALAGLATPALRDALMWSDPDS